MAMIRPRPSRLASWKIRRVLTSIPEWPETVDDHVLDGRQGAQGVADEVGITGRVDQVDLPARPFEVEQVAVDGEVAAFLLVVDVGEARPLVDRAAAVGRAGGVEQGVGKRGLARRPMSSQGNVADIGDVIGRGHGVSSPLGFGGTELLASRTGVPRHRCDGDGSTKARLGCRSRSPARFRASL